MDLVTIRGVELVKVGTWNSSTGQVPIAPADLAAAVAAAQDPDVGPSPIKFGHLGPPPANPDPKAQAAASLAADAAPAVGWLENLRTSEDGTTLLADLTNVPRKVAAMMRSAFRKRSAELAFGLRTPAGRRHRMAVTGLSLLGATPPAIQSLADVADLYDLAAAPSTMGADWRASLTTVTGAAGDDLTAADALGHAATLPPSPIPPAGAPSRQNDPEPANPTPPEAPAMTLTNDRLAELLNVEADADLEAAVADLVERAAAADTGDGTDDGTDDATPPVEDREPVGAALSGLTPEVAEALASAGLHVITEGALADLRTQAAAGAEAAARLAAADHDAALDAAIADGRITPAERDRYAEAIAENPEPTLALLSGLTPGKFPTVEAGHALANGDPTEDQALDAFLSSLGIADAVAE